MYSKQLIERLAQYLLKRNELRQLVVEERHRVRSIAVGEEVSVSVLVAGADPQVLFIHLDGGTGNRETLLKRQATVAALLATSTIPDSIHLSFSGGADAFYAQGWEDWVIDELPQWAARHYRFDLQPHTQCLSGMSAGGHGALKIAFKQPARFRAVAAIAPAILPTLCWPEPHRRASWWLLEDSARAVWGEPFPASFFDDHPPNIVNANASEIRAAGLDVYLEVGDEDLLNLQDGVEFLHRILWQQDIAHEYRLLRWADHGGFSIEDRFVEAMAFLAASLAGGKAQSRDVVLNEAEQAFVDYMLAGGPMGQSPTPGNMSSGTVESELTVMHKLWAPLRSLAAAQDPTMRNRYGRLPDPDPEAGSG